MQAGARSGKMPNSGSTQKPCPNQKVKRNQGMHIMSTLDIHMYAHTCVHVPARMHKQKRKGKDEEKQTAYLETVDVLSTEQLWLR